MQIPTCQNWCCRVPSLPQDSQGLSGPAGSLVAPLHWQSGLRIQSILWRQSARPILYSLPSCVLHTHLQTQCHSGGQYEERSVHVEFTKCFLFWELQFSQVFQISVMWSDSNQHAQKKLILFTPRKVSSGCKMLCDGPTTFFFYFFINININPF